MAIAAASQTRLIIVADDDGLIGAHFHVHNALLLLERVLVMVIT
jgi:hypothetical protein